MNNEAGFWIRTAAALLDGLILAAVTLPLLYLVYGEPYFTADPQSIVVFGFWDVFFNYIFPVVATLFFWLKYGATPGKMLCGLRLADAQTGGGISFGQAVIRYIGYFVSALVLLLGYFWVGFDKRKQGWHDKMAGTVVVKKQR